MPPVLLTGLLGVALGVRHALEPDHLAALSTLLADRRSARTGMVMGGVWGLGHALSLLVVGGGLALAGERMPIQLATIFEGAVAVMIVSLGVRAIVKASREGRAGVTSEHRRSHEASVESVLPAPRVESSAWAVATKPLLIGVLHGLAGSGALTALVLAELSSGAERLSYIALFGGGTVLGMAALTGLAGLPLGRLLRAPRAGAALLGAAGLLSVGLGLWWVAESCSALLPRG